MTDNDSSETMVVYSDYLCPFCYLGKESMESYLDEAENEENIDIEWRPFDIQGAKRQPDGTLDHEADDGKGEAYFERARRNVERLSREYDVDMSMDLPDEIDSWNAQKVALAIDDHFDRETFSAFHDAVFEALWRDNLDIGEPYVLVDIAASVGIPEDDVRQAVESDELDEELESRFEEARREGVTGIPTFTYGPHTLQGAVPSEQFSRLLE